MTITNEFYTFKTKIVFFKYFIILFSFVIYIITPALASEFVAFESYCINLSEKTVGPEDGIMTIDRTKPNEIQKRTSASWNNNDFLDWDHLFRINYDNAHCVNGCEIHLGSNNITNYSNCTCIQRFNSSDRSSLFPRKKDKNIIFLDIFSFNNIEWVDSKYYYKNGLYEYKGSVIVDEIEQYRMRIGLCSGRR